MIEYKQIGVLHKMNTVSVIIPTWNRSVLLEEAVKSVLTQTHSPLEILVCDDGSTDDSEAVISSIGDNRIRWVACGHSGRPAIPRNIGISESRGKWLAFLDNDDVWLPDKLHKQLSLAQATGCRAVCSNAHRFVPNVGITGNYLSWKNERISFATLSKVNQVICSSALVHKSIFAEVHGFPEEAHLKALEDYALWLRVATQTDFAFVAEPMLIYRDDAANSIRSKGIDLWQQRKDVFDNFLEWGGGGVKSRFLLTVKMQYYISSIRSRFVKLLS